MSSTAEPVKCRKCHRPLRSAASCAAGIGPRCAAIEAAFDGLNGKQQDKARELIADGGIVKVRPGVYQVRASDGSGNYLTTADGNCGCPWGLHRTSATAKTCYHVGAVRLAEKPRLTVAARSSLAKAA